MRNSTLLLFSLFFFLNNQLFSQPIGRIDDHSRQQSFTLFANGYVEQVGNPLNRGQAVRDPSGFMYLMLPSTTPHFNAFFINWNNQLVEIGANTGIRIVGNCLCPPPVNPYINIYQAPNYSRNIGISTPNGFRPFPNQLSNHQNPYGNALITNENQARLCYESSLKNDGTLNEKKFGNCMVGKLVGSKELEIYNCVKNASSEEDRTICLFGILGGLKEREIAQKLNECYTTYGNEYSKYPLCLSGNSTDGSLGKVLACMEQQSKQGDVSIMKTAICYGASNLDMNPETQIIVECAIASGGEPYSFAGCAGGQLVSRELDKCLDYGIGGENGCFGENNDIIKALNNVGNVINFEFGPNNEVSRLWNNSVRDITEGPGQNHEAVKTLRNISNEVGRAKSNIDRELTSTFKKITGLF